MYLEKRLIPHIKMIGCQRLARQAMNLVQNASRKGFLTKTGFFRKNQLKVLSATPMRVFGDFSKNSIKEVKTEETGGYYKDKIDMTDRFYDPYYPYVWAHVLPRSWQPYLRFCRIDQTFARQLVINPHLWGIAAASTLGGIPDMLMLFWFMTGGLYAHGFSVSWDDFADVPVDKTMERTKRRPLVEQIMTKKSAIAIMTLQTVGALSILALLSPPAIKVGLICGPAIMLYPFMKRFFQYPQVYLAFALNLGVFFGYGAVAGFIYWPVAIPLYIAGVSNTIFYDSIYAFQDIEADLAIGTYSTSQKFAKHPKAIMGGLATISVVFHSIAGFMAGFHPSFLIGMASGASFLGWEVWKLDTKNAPLCDHLLNISYIYGVIVLFTYMWGVFFSKGKRRKIEEEIKKKAAIST